jgi:NAD(P)-dependent dehydrogenase (short-subunit alcohol dehydrogenase family)
MSKPVVLITGALSGIGRATALAFAAKERGSACEGLVAASHPDGPARACSES